MSYLDFFLRHSLVGIGSRNSFAIDETTGVVTTSKNSVFDYEKETEVVIQVQAIDSLDEPLHRTMTQLTVTVLDVNDETPRIWVVSTECIRSRPFVHKKCLAWHADSCWRESKQRHACRRQNNSDRWRSNPGYEVLHRLGQIVRNQKRTAGQRIRLQRVALRVLSY